MLQSWWGECSHWYTHAWMMTCFFSNRAEHVRKQSRLRVEVSRTSVAHHDCVVMEAFKGRTFNFEISKLISNTWTRITSKLLQLPYMWTRITSTYLKLSSRSPLSNQRCLQCTCHLGSTAALDLEGLEELHAPRHQRCSHLETTQVCVLLLLIMIHDVPYFLVIIYIYI